MATLPEQFKKALSNIEPESADVTNAAAAHDAYAGSRKLTPTLTRWDIDPVLIGSFSRAVSIQRVKDVDVFGRLTQYEPVGTTGRWMPAPPPGFPNALRIGSLPGRFVGNPVNETDTPAGFPEIPYTLGVGFPVIPVKA